MRISGLLLIVCVGLVAGLGAGTAQARGPKTAPVGTPCFCAFACQQRGATFSTWIDPAGARVGMASCPPADAGQLAQNGGMCTCNNPLDWYLLWNEMHPQQPNATSPNH